MANRQRGYGLTADVARKLEAKYDPEKEIEAREWMTAVTGEELEGSTPGEAMGSKNLHVALKDGSYLCKLANAVIGQGTCKTNSSKLAFKQMENINNFLVACEKYGVNKTDLFMTADLYDNQNMWSVVCAIHALGRRAQTMGFDGPVLGPREAQRNTRQFTEEQMAEGKAVIGLQMGTNKLASQSGMNFGATRKINDMKVDEGTKEGQSVIGLQMGTNQVASQSGLNFGKSRGIMGVDK